MNSVVVAPRALSCLLYNPLLSVRTNPSVCDTATRACVNQPCIAPSKRATHTPSRRRLKRWWQRRRRASSCRHRAEGSRRAGTTRQEMIAERAAGADDTTRHHTSTYALRATALELADAASLGRAHAHDAGVHSAGHAVVLLGVELGQGVSVEGGGGLDIVQGAGVDDVAHEEALDGLILKQARRHTVSHGSCDTGATATQTTKRHAVTQQATGTHCACTHATHGHHRPPQERRKTTATSYEPWRACSRSGRSQPGGCGHGRGENGRRYGASWSSDTQRRNTHAQGERVSCKQAWRTIGGAIAARCSLADAGRPKRPARQPPPAATPQHAHTLTRTLTNRRLSWAVGVWVVEGEQGERAIGTKRGVRDVNIGGGRGRPEKKFESKSKSKHEFDSVQTSNHHPIKALVHSSSIVAGSPQLKQVDSSCRN